MVILLGAMTKNGVIGNKNSLPGNIKAEMQYFQQLTKNKTVLMGAKTFASIKKPLKNRTNIIITRHIEKYQQYENSSCIISNDLLKILNKYHHDKTQELGVIGGAEIYQQAGKYADYLYVSIINYEYAGDCYFPYDDFSNFELLKTTRKPEFTAYVYQKKTLLEKDNKNELI